MRRHTLTLRSHRIRAAGALAALALAVLALPGLARAHAQLDRAEPPVGSAVDTAPKQVRLTFSEPLEASFSRVQVLDPGGTAVDLGDSKIAPDDPYAMVVSLRDGLADGLYTVSWRTLSAVDGHTLNGAYPLVVGEVPEGVSLAATGSSQATFQVETAFARWWLFAAGSVLFGTLLSWPLLYRPLFGRGQRDAERRTAGAARWLALAAAGTLVVGVLWGAIAQAAAVSGGSAPGAFGSPLVDLLARGRFATIWWPRLGLAVLALLLVAVGGVRGLTGRLALAATAGVLLTSSLTSHQAALASGAHLAVAIDWLHFTAVAAWVGGLASLLLVPPRAVAATEGGERVLARGVQRFSNFALGCVVVIVATGTFLAWLQVGSLEGLWSTGYGLSILAKLLGMGGLVAVAAFNLLVVRPRLAGLAGKGAAAVAALRQRFGLAVRAELAVATAVLVAAAVLTGVVPAREELARRASGQGAGGPVDRTLDAGGLAARVRIAPAAVGQNRFEVDLPGTDPAVVERVQLTLSFLDQEMGSQPLVLQAAEGRPGTWQASSPLLSQAGQWQAELFVRRVATDDARGAFRFTVLGAGGATGRSLAPVAAYPLLPSPMGSLAYGLIAAGVVAAGYAVLRPGRVPRQGRAAATAAGLVVALCGGYVYAQEQRGGTTLDVVNVRSPVPPDQRSLAAGQAIYEQYCASCHGDTGRGDGPAGLRLVPRPADLRVHMAAGHTDGQLFYWVSYGVPGTAMPAWEGALTEQQLWDVINYLRTFAEPGAVDATVGGPP